ncbi:MAG: tetratricopeptide repeat protein [Devosia sp.]
MVGRKGLALAVIALGAVLLSGCSSLVGQSTFGSNRLAVAELPDVGDYTADRALTEARAHFRNNDFGYSAALYKRVVELSPKNSEGYVGLGASYDRLGRFDLADRVYASLYSLSGASAQYYNNLGYSYMLRGNFSGALTNLRKAKAMAPDSVVVANNLELLAAATRA